MCAAQVRNVERHTSSKSGMEDECIVLGQWEACEGAAAKTSAERTPGRPTFRLLCGMTTQSSTQEAPILHWATIIESAPYQFITGGNILSILKTFTLISLRVSEFTSLTARGLLEGRLQLRGNVKRGVLYHLDHWPRPGARVGDRGHLEGPGSDALSPVNPWRESARVGRAKGPWGRGYTSSKSFASFGTT